MEGPPSLLAIQFHGFEMLLRKPTVLITTAPWIQQMAPRMLTAERRQQLADLKNFHNIAMVRKYHDKTGKLRVVWGLI